MREQHLLHPSLNRSSNGRPPMLWAKDNSDELYEKQSSRPVNFIFDTSLKSIEFEATHNRVYSGPIREYCNVENG